jgi:hypothetical protein
MMKSSDNIDRYFKKKLEGFKEIPPQDTWDKIANRLGHSRKRKMVVFISRIAAGITILVSLSVFFHYTQKNKHGELAQKNDTTTEIKPVDIDNRSALSGKKQTARTKIKLPENRMTDNAIQEKPVHSGAVNHQTTRQVIQTKRIFPVSDNISYLMPIACNYLDIGHSGSVLKLSGRDEHNIEQVHKSYDNQLSALIDEEPVEKKWQTEWLLGGQFAPLYSYRNLKSDSYQDYVRNQINSKESGIIAYAGGINLTVSPGRRLSVQSGIYYSKYGQEKNSLENMVFINPNSKNDYADYTSGDASSQEQIQSVYIGNSTGKIIGSDEGMLNFFGSPSENLLPEQTRTNQLNSSLPIRSITQYFEYLEVPVNLKYKVMDKKFDVTLMGGISTNFLIGTDIQLNYTDNSSKNTDYTTEGLNRINYSGLIGIGFEYPLLKNLIFNIEPKFRYYMNAINKDQVYNIHPYSIGVFSGISYLF